jgi:transposase
VSWRTVMNAVREHGEPLVGDPTRVGVVGMLGVDETSWLKANADHPPGTPPALWTSPVGSFIDVIPGNTSSDLGSWLDRQPTRWLSGVRVVATDLAESYRSALAGHLEHAIRVADPFHVVRVANRCLDLVRRRVQNQTLGHRGRKRDPLYRVRN